MTGRAAGVCAGYGVPGYMNPVGGRGFGYWGWGRGRGGGRGRRHWFWATGLPGWARAGYGPWGGTAAPFAAPAAPTAQQELDALKQQAAYFKDALDDIQKRIGELEAEASAQT